jgi:Peptidase family S41
MLRPVLSGSLTILLCIARFAETQSAPPAAASPSASIAARVSPPESTAPPIDALDAADLQQALALIRNNYVARDLLSDTEMNRAALAGLLGRLGRSVLLLPARGGEPASSPPPFYREIIDGHIGYLRPGALSKSDLQETDATLQNFAGKKVDAIILDLRGTTETNDYAVAAEFAKRFVPKEKPLFTLRGPMAKQERVFTSNQEPAYNGFIILLVDGETAGAPEALAGALRFYDKAIVIGETTAGRAVQYSDLPLPSGKILRVAVAAIVLPNQRACFPEGIRPDLPVMMSREAKRQIFQQSLTNGIAPFVFESDRPHLNEAALLAGTNPEIEAAQAAQQRHARGGVQPVLHDAALQRAVDLISSIDVYQKQPGRAP